LPTFGSSRIPSTGHVDGITMSDFSRSNGSPRSFARLRAPLHSTQRGSLRSSPFTLFHNVAARARQTSSFRQPQLRVLPDCNVTEPMLRMLPHVHRQNQKLPGRASRATTVKRPNCRPTRSMRYRAHPQDLLLLADTFDASMRRCLPQSHWKRYSEPWLPMRRSPKHTRRPKRAPV